MSLNPAQIFYCLEQIKLDKKEEWEDSRDKLEYIAMFINSEAVQKVQNYREQAKDSEQSEEALNNLLQDKFGNSLVDEIRVIDPSEIKLEKVPSSFAINPADYIPEQQK